MNNEMKLVPKYSVIELLEDAFFEFETAERAFRNGELQSISHEARIDQTIGIMYRLNLIHHDEFVLLDEKVERIKEQVALDIEAGKAEKGKRGRL